MNNFPELNGKIKYDSTGYYKTRQCAITIYDSSEYYKLRQYVITICDRCIITIYDSYYKSRQLLLQFTTFISIHDSEDDCSTMDKMVEFIQVVRQRERVYYKRNNCGSNEAKGKSNITLLGWAWFTTLTDTGDAT